MDENVEHPEGQEPVDTNKRVLADLQSDYTMAQSYYHVWRERRDGWIREYNGDPYGNEEDGKSTIVSRDIKKVSAWQHAAIIDPFVTANDMVETFPITFEDQKAAEQSNLVLNYQFCRDFSRYNFISTAFKVLQREGTVVAKVSWETEEREEQVEVPVYETKLLPSDVGFEYQTVQAGTKFVTQTVVVKNRPTAEVVDNVMLYVDPTCIGDISNAQFVITKYMSNMTKLDAAGLYKDLDKIPKSTGTAYTGQNDQYEKRDTNQFTFSDDARKEIEVFEYWGNYDLNGDGKAVPIVCVWAENTIIRLEENPYPDNAIPFISCSYDNEPFSINGNANADLIGADQKIKTGIKRAFNNTLNAGTQGQKGTPKGMLDPLNLKAFHEGRDFEYNIGTSGDVWEGKFSDIPVSTMNFYNSITAEIEALTGVRTGNAGQTTNSLESKTPLAMSATEKREVDISRNFKENLLVPLLRKWHSMNAEFLEDSQIIRITNGDLVEVRRDDMDGNIDIEITISTPATDAEKASDLSFMLQTMGQSLPFDLTKMLLAEQAKLKRMPGLAQQIEAYQQQPDPLEVERQQLEIEKLRAEIMERQSRANENQVDMRLKSAKSANEEAKARETHAKADNQDLDFLRKQSGQDVVDEIDKQNNKDSNQAVLNKAKTTS